MKIERLSNTKCLLSLFILLLILCGSSTQFFDIFGSDDSPRTAEDILEEKLDKEEESSFNLTDYLPFFGDSDKRENDKQGSIWDNLRFWQKKKEEKEAISNKEKILKIIEQEAEAIGVQRPFMNDRVDLDPSFKHLTKSVQRIQYCLTPVDRFRQMGDGNNNSAVQDSDNYLRRLRVLMGRVYQLEDDLVQNIAILSTNFEAFLGIDFRIDVLYLGKDEQTDLDVINANNDPKLHPYYIILNQLNNSFKTKVKEMLELTKTTDNQLRQLYGLHNNIMATLNRENQRFYDDFHHVSFEEDRERKKHLADVIKTMMEKMYSKQDDLDNEVNQIGFIVSELKDLAPAYNHFWANAKSVAQKVIADLRQTINKGPKDFEAYFKKQDEENERKRNRNRVVDKIQDHKLEIKDITNTQIGADVLNTVKGDPKSKTDPFLHLRDKDYIKQVEKQQKQEEDSENQKTDTEEDSIEAKLRANQQKLDNLILNDVNAEKSLYTDFFKCMIAVMLVQLLIN